MLFRYQVLSLEYLHIRYTNDIEACAFGREMEMTWRTEFSKWCDAYQAYTEEYKYWSCLMVRFLWTVGDCVVQFLSSKIKLLMSAVFRCLRRCSL